MAELAGLFSESTGPTGVEELTREEFVKVKTLVSFDAAVEQVKLAKLEHLWRVSIVRVLTVEFETLSLHEEIAEWRFGPRARPSLPMFGPRPLGPVQPAKRTLVRRCCSRDIPPFVPVPLAFVVPVAGGGGARLGVRGVRVRRVHRGLLNSLVMQYVQI